MSGTVDTATDVFSSLKNFASQPFTANMSAGGWFAFFGLVAAISVAWGLILKDLRGEI